MNASHDQMDRVDRARLVRSGGARDDSPSWNLGRVKQGDTIRVDGPSPLVSRARGREGVREWVLQNATSTRPSHERERGRTQDQGVVRRSRRLDDSKCGQERHRCFPSFIKDHRQLRRAHDHPEYRGEKEIVSIRS